MNTSNTISTALMILLALGSGSAIAASNEQEAMEKMEHAETMQDMKKEGMEKMDGMKAEDMSKMEGDMKDQTMEKMDGMKEDGMQKMDGDMTKDHKKKAAMGS